MRKSSLGRRRSSAVNSQRMGSLGSDSLRKSAIPVKMRPSSQDRSMISVQSATKTRSKSAHDEMTPRNSKVPYNQNLPSGTIRPGRTATMSTDSMRRSSFGGSKMKKDLRPLQDKEWQLATERRICAYFNKEVEGASIIKNTHIKNMSLNLFLDMMNYLVKKLDPSFEINKANYILEVPFHLKKLQYRGKVDKSWLVTVNVPHVWPYVLGALHFLVESLECMESLDSFTLMFPEEFICEDIDDYRDPKALLPYYIQSYELYKSGTSDYDAQQDELDEMIRQNQVSDDVFQSIKTLERDNEELKEEIKKMKNQISQIHIEFQENILAKLNEDMKNEYNYKLQQEGYIQNLKDFIEGANSELLNLGQVLELRTKEKEKLLNEIDCQKISYQEVELLKQKRASLKHAIESDSKSIEEFSEFFFKEDMQVVVLKRKLDELIRQYNLSIASYIELEIMLEEVKIDENVLHTKPEDITSELSRRFKNLEEKYTSLLESDKRDVRDYSQILVKLRNEVTEGKRITEEKNAEYEKIVKEKVELMKAINLRKESLEKELLDICEKKKNLINFNTSEQKEELDLKLEIVQEMEMEISCISGQYCKFVEGLKKIREKFVQDLQECIGEVEAPGTIIWQNMEKSS